MQALLAKMSSSAPPGPGGDQPGRRSSSTPTNASKNKKALAKAKVEEEFFNKKFWCPPDLVKGSMGFTFKDSTITKIEPGKWADSAGLRVGDEIVLIETTFVGKDPIVETVTRPLRHSKMLSKSSTGSKSSLAITDGSPSASSPGAAVVLPDPMRSSRSGISSNIPTGRGSTTSSDEQLSSGVETEEVKFTQFECLSQTEKIIRLKNKKGVGFVITRKIHETDLEEAAINLQAAFRGRKERSTSVAVAKKQQLFANPFRIEHPPLSVPFALHRSVERNLHKQPPLRSVSETPRQRMMEFRTTLKKVDEFDRYNSSASGRGNGNDFRYGEAGTLSGGPFFSSLRGPPPPQRVVVPEGEAGGMYMLDSGEDEDEDASRLTTPPPRGSTPRGQTPRKSLSSSKNSTADNKPGAVSSTLTLNLPATSYRTSAAVRSRGPGSSSQQQEPPILEDKMQNAFLKSDFFGRGRPSSIIPGSGAIYDREDSVRQVAAATTRHSLLIDKIGFTAQDSSGRTVPVVPLGGSVPPVQKCRILPLPPKSKTSPNLFGDPKKFGQANRGNNAGVIVGLSGDAEDEVDVDIAAQTPVNGDLQTGKIKTFFNNVKENFASKLQDVKEKVQEKRQISREKSQERREILMEKVEKTKEIVKGNVDLVKEKLKIPRKERGRKNKHPKEGPVTVESEGEDSPSEPSEEDLEAVLRQTETGGDSVQLPGAASASTTAASPQSGSTAAGQNIKLPSSSSSTTVTRTTPSGYNNNNPASLRPTGSSSLQPVGGRTTTEAAVDPQQIRGGDTTRTTGTSPSMASTKISENNRGTNSRRQNASADVLSVPAPNNDPLGGLDSTYANVQAFETSLHALEGLEEQKATAQALLGSKMIHALTVAHQGEDLFNFNSLATRTQKSKREDDSSGSEDEFTEPKNKTKTAKMDDFLGKEGTVFIDKQTSRISLNAPHPAQHQNLQSNKSVKHTSRIIDTQSPSQARITGLSSRDTTAAQVLPSYTESLLPADMVAEWEENFDYGYPRIQVPQAESDEWTLSSMLQIVKHCQTRPEMPLHPLLVVRMLEDITESMDKKYPTPVNYLQIPRNVVDEEVVGGDGIMSSTSYNNNDITVDYGAKDNINTLPSSTAKAFHHTPSAGTNASGSSGSILNSIRQKAQQSSDQKLAEKVRKIRKSRLPSVLDSDAISRPGRLIVVGDTHGQLTDVLWIFYKNGLPSPSNAYLFNGDIADRGFYATEIFMLVYGFMLLYPEAVHINRGNHEDLNMNLDPRCGGFYKEVIQKYGPNLGEIVFNTFLKTYAMLPLATVLEKKIFVVHGGLSRVREGNFELLRSAIDNRSICMPDSVLQSADMAFVDALWADPSDNPGISKSSRGPSMIYFGPDVTRQFLEENGFKQVIRSHQPPKTKDGVNWHHDGKLITVFSASNYCGWYGNQGAVLIFTPYQQSRASALVDAFHAQYQPQALSRSITPISTIARPPAPPGLVQGSPPGAGTTTTKVVQLGGPSKLTPKIGGLQFQPSFENIGKPSVGSNNSKTSQRSADNFAHDPYRNSSGSDMTENDNWAMPEMEVVRHFSPTFEELRTVDICTNDLRGMLDLPSFFQHKMRQNFATTQLEVSAQRKFQSQGLAERLDRLVYEVKSRIARLIVEEKHFLYKTFAEFEHAAYLSRNTTQITAGTSSSSGVFDSNLVQEYKVSEVDKDDITLTAGGEEPEPISDRFPTKNPSERTMSASRGGSKPPLNNFLAPPGSITVEQWQQGLSSVMGTDEVAEGIPWAQLKQVLQVENPLTKMVDYPILLSRFRVLMREMEQNSAEKENPFSFQARQSRRTSMRIEQEAGEQEELRASTSGTNAISVKDRISGFLFGNNNKTTTKPEGEAQTNADAASNKTTSAGNQADSPADRKRKRREMLLHQSSLTTMSKNNLMPTSVLTRAGSKDMSRGTSASPSTSETEDEQNRRTSRVFTASRHQKFGADGSGASSVGGPPPSDSRLSSNYPLNAIARSSNRLTSVDNRTSVLAVANTKAEWLETILARMFEQLMLADIPWMELVAAFSTGAEVNQESMLVTLPVLQRVLQHASRKTNTAPVLSEQQAGALMRVLLETKRNVNTYTGAGGAGDINSGEQQGTGDERDSYVDNSSSKKSPKRAHTSANLIQIGGKGTTGSKDSNNKPTSKSPSKGARRADEEDDDDRNSTPAAYGPKARKKANTKGTVMSSLPSKGTTTPTRPGGTPNEMRRTKLLNQGITQLTKQPAVVVGLPLAEFLQRLEQCYTGYNASRLHQHTGTESDLRAERALSLKFGNSAMATLLRLVGRELRYSRKSTFDLFREADVSRTGYLSKEEFTNAVQKLLKSALKGQDHAATGSSRSRVSNGSSASSAAVGWTMLQQHGITEQLVDELYTAVDLGGQNRVNYLEFLYCFSTVGGGEVIRSRGRNKSSHRLSNNFPLIANANSASNVSTSIGAGGHSRSKAVPGGAAGGSFSAPLSTGPSGDAIIPALGDLHSTPNRGHSRDSFEESDPLQEAIEDQIYSVLYSNKQSLLQVFQFFQYSASNHAIRSNDKNASTRDSNRAQNRTTATVGAAAAPTSPTRIRAIHFVKSLKALNLALSLNNPPLTNEQIQRIADHFEDSATNTIDYQVFLDSLVVVDLLTGEFFD